MIVGIKIDGFKKVYYYHTSKNYYIGQRIKVLAPSGGTPNAIIVETNVKKTLPIIRELIEG